ncbi:TraB/GumN family protein [Paracoccus sp. DMF-8]|uniref:TraB/GumN family protein n=1 Tax=Paracoccus sp. DMF-8 TaxID=3019445 RepID=UPI0023E84C9E|nr:TraB/GumN family protein [Paracoccus sp. DMF-8]MDF3606196.1 TraB/GumN family protein [Paracoccus sp. DMF-8]
MRLAALRLRLTAAALSVFASVFALAAPVSAAECVGQDLIARMDPDQRAALDAAVEGVPFRHGLFWEARKDDMRLTLIGTYHFGDPRHDAVLDRFGPMIDEADRLLVEAGPQEMARLQQAMIDDPNLLMDQDGPTLPERLAPGEWDSVSQTMGARGIPAFVVSKMRPWYVSMMMGLSPCMLQQVAETGKTGGLDQLLMDRAEISDTPIAALEPWDTLFSLFQGLTPDEEIEMIVAALPAAEHADDYGTTLVNAYFQQDVWRIWEFGRIDAYENSGLPRDRIDQQFVLAQTKMMDERNESWIAPLTDAARQAAERQAADKQAADKRVGGHVIAAFGALHLPGEKGVLNLLQQDGWTLTRLNLNLPDRAN